MRIVIVMPVYWPSIGGCEVHTHELVTRLSRRHHVEVVTAICKDEDKELGKWFMWSPLLAAARQPERYQDGNAQVIRVGMPYWWKMLLYLLLRVCGTERLPAPLCRQAGKLFLAGYRRQLRRFVGKPDLIHAIHQDCAWFGFAALQLANELGIPFAYTPVSHIYTANKAIAGGYTEQQPAAPADAPAVLHGIFGNMFVRSCAEARVLFAMTNVEKRFFENNRINGNVCTIGVGPVLHAGPVPDIREKYNIPKNSPLVLFLGRINNDKGFAAVLAATHQVWQEEPEAYFLFVGPFERGSEASFSRRSDRRVIATGAIDLEWKTSALQACDVMCLPSVNESLGGVYLEAWSFGKPVVGATIPPFLELTGNGQGGVAVEPTPDGVARGILLLLRDPEAGRRMGAWGREQVRMHYDWETIASKVEACYQTAVGGRIASAATGATPGTTSAFPQ
jgi:glycosyltransferase involved in cell wall biosynthesis